MRMPERPPDFQEVMAKQVDADREALAAIVSASRTVAGDGNYLHWDKLRHRQPPEGLTREMWWAALKMARAGQLRDTPLVDVHGQPFRYGLPDPSAERLHHIDQNAAGGIEVREGEIASPGLRDRYIVRSLVEEAITSSQLEGAATTRRVAKEMIRTGRRPGDKSEWMILNNYVAMQRIRGIKDRPLTAELLLELHEVLTARTMDDPSVAGRFRRADELIEMATPYNEVLHTPPPAEKLGRRLQGMYDFANGKTPRSFIHPVIRAILLHFWLAYEHPFVDGNGRCARAMFYWSMLRQGYWLSEFISISQIIRKAPARYGRAFLYTETDDNDLTYFILYHLEIIERAIRELHRYIATKTEETRRTERLIRASAGLNHRQVALLGHAIRHPDAEYTIESHRMSHGVVYQTARTDLLGLVEKRLLVARKRGRKFIFCPVEDLAEQLAKLR